MSGETLGQAEQERAFMEWWLKYAEEVYVSRPPRKGWMVEVARTAYAAGAERAISLRGCCDHQERGAGT